MVKEVKRIINRNAHQHRTNPYHDYGNVRLEKGNHTQGEKPAEKYGEGYPENIAFPPHHPPQHQHYQHDGYNHGDEAVPLYLRSVADGNQRSPDRRHIHTLHLRADLAGDALELLVKTGVVFGVVGGIWSLYKSKGIPVIFIEQVALLNLIGIGLAQAGQPLQRGREKV